MTKQEALEALLTKARQWERPDQEKAAVPFAQVLGVLDRNIERLMGMLEDEELSEASVAQGERGAALICIGAAALYLLVDDWPEPVAGRDLEDWLADQPSAVKPVAVNGVIGRVL